MNLLYGMAVLLFGSGMCALVYQVAWLRELRLVFGASTAASAAVLAIFMGGLGLGGALLGRRAERHENPLRLYAHLELGIAAVTAVTPFLLWGVRQVYFSLGGSPALGLSLATILRLVFSALVLGAPTFLMGGTLPAAARAVETQKDVGRTNLAVLYGLNTFGAVTGALLTTFLLLEVLGTHRTLWCACLVNALVGLTARGWSRSLDPARPIITDVSETGPVVDISASDAPDALAASEPGMIPESLGAAAPVIPGVPPDATPRWLVYLAAGLVGFVFFIMELVWYRMLAPLLGGSTYTFGLILAVALAGIGLGGWFYSQKDRSTQATLGAFGLTCALEAMFLIIPYALGDRLAILAALMRPLGNLGIEGHALAWALITFLVAFPAAVVAGYQFPLLISLLGRGGEGVAVDTGRAYAFNTAGAIVGSLAGGFLLVPGLSATGAWRLSVVLLALLALAAWVVSGGLKRRSLGGMVTVGALVLAAGLAGWSTGPTAFWRYSPIGAGRVDFSEVDINQLKDGIHRRNAYLVWGTDSLESAVGVDGLDGYAFMVNGKVDGNATGDASTQIGLGLIGAVLHPQPQKTLVIGLGTGSTAGWLAQVPGMNRVDVAELEPAILEVARMCTPVNQKVLDNPKVNVMLGDGREILLTSGDQYDLIVSEPSNPYRAGIASLYTLEFYQAAALRLAKGGLFLQWVQAYEIDTQTIRTIYSTLAQVFPYVYTWETNDHDMSLIGSMEPLNVDTETLKRRLNTEPFRTGFEVSFWTHELEGFLAHFVAGPRMAKTIADQEKEHPSWSLNTDDRMLVEFMFARTVGKARTFSLEDIRTENRSRPELGDKPPVTGPYDAELMDERRGVLLAMDQNAPVIDTTQPEATQWRVRALARFLDGNLVGLLESWKKQDQTPRIPLETAMLAEALADQADSEAEPMIQALRSTRPIDADLIEARLAWRKGMKAEAVEALGRGYEKLKAAPWAYLPLARRSFSLAQEIAAGDPKEAAPRVFGFLEKPFACNYLESSRQGARMNVAYYLGLLKQAQVLEQEYEPFIPWRKSFLSDRYRIYRAAGHPLKDQAERDWLEFMENESISFPESLKAQTQEAKETAKAP